MHKVIQTALAAQSRGHYSQGVRCGNFLFISGQLPIDPHGNVVKGTVSEQAAQALKNVRAIVEAAGGTIAQIVQCTIYISHIDDWAEVNGTYAAFFSAVRVAPARAVVPVKEMHYGSQIEIQAIAFLEESSDAKRTGKQNSSEVSA